MFLMNNSSRFRDFGLFIIRFSAGAIMVYVHGYDKITAGASHWHESGLAMDSLGIHFAYTFWGFMSAFTEFVGGIFIALGLLFRPFTLLMIINFIVASLSLINAGQPLAHSSQPVLLLFVFIGLLITGPGKFSGDQLIGLNK
jgi:putative oxidoreductase